jgi:hypothetical protein
VPILFLDRTSITRGKLTLDANTGFSTQLLVDFQVLFACVAVADSQSSVGQPLNNEIKKVFKLLHACGGMSSRILLCIRRSNVFK